MEHSDIPESLLERLRDGFDRIALVLRSDLWSAASAAGLNAAQAQVLGLLANRPFGLRPKEIAAHLAVTPASIADTVSALKRKGLVKRESDPVDARAAIVTATPNGLRLGVDIATSESKLADAIAGLSPTMQEELLLTQIALIRQLQNAGAIPLQRMCVSCRHFRPHAHPDRAKPHHCAFVDAAIDGRELRLDCSEHEAAAPDVQAATWTSFAKGSPSPQAQPSN
ncbi:MarR family winged helix-turn-helix transcriptional regulator [Ochrobactrum vermis]|uniref:MarR family winged helix-turn-helix transcriptional regulator n=1 Tax=Ochrobactrum vermis TaxID=1827297 RepID=A0ABU8PL51_9HYPH|nr:MarR family winged helix-turn-helix transcriptional regulator [Ochrobactrum vermis]PQZ24370.1 transcriptional regulator [Ochrobactrum vermis]